MRTLLTILVLCSFSALAMAVCAFEQSTSDRKLYKNPQVGQQILDERIKVVSVEENESPFGWTVVLQNASDEVIDKAVYVRAYDKNGRYATNGRDPGFVVTMKAGQKARLVCQPVVKFVSSFGLEFKDRPAKK
jgi:hypothetical protein